MATLLAITQQFLSGICLFLRSSFSSSSLGTFASTCVILTIFFISAIKMYLYKFVLVLSFLKSSFWLGFSPWSASYCRKSNKRQDVLKPSIGPGPDLCDCLCHALNETWPVHLALPQLCLADLKVFFQQLRRWQYQPVCIVRWHNATRHRPLNNIVQIDDEKFTARACTGTVVCGTISILFSRTSTILARNW